jgi:hypothetical protein
MGKYGIPDLDPDLDGIFPTTTAHSKKTTLKTDFKGWHKPRKQWVRQYQWLQEIDKLCQILRFENGQPLRYLSLPGTDMLDVRCLHSWCKEKEIFLKFLGYNDPDDSADPNDTELHLSQAELTQREFIDGGSIVIQDKFEKIGDKNSVAYARMAQAGSFDVINLDLCNSVAGYVPLKKQDDYYNAISNIVQFQKENRHQPWLLFITTRGDRGSVNANAEKKLFKHIVNNAKSHESFRSKLTDCLGVNSTSITANNEEIYHRIIGLGLGKWLLGLLFNGQPKWRIKMLESAEYKVYYKSKVPDMLSLAFECSLIVQVPCDRVGLAMSATKHENVEEVEFATCLIDAVRGLKNIDRILRSDLPLHSSLIEKAAHLMKDARYDDKEYKKWAMKY